MSTETLEALRHRGLEHASKGDWEEAAQVFSVLTERDPTAPDGWINLASVERERGHLRTAVEHFREGIRLGRQLATQDRSFLCTALTALGSTLQALELTGEAVQAYQEAARMDPRATQCLAGLASLLARGGHLAEADTAARRYCLAAVSVLAEKENIGDVRRFQQAMKEASTVDGARLLAATREAYVHSFDQMAATLPEGVRFEEEPFVRGPEGKPVPALANPARPFARVRFDAIHPTTGQRWMIHERPTYGFPRDCPAASQGFFSVPGPFDAPFPVLVSTRTAWDYFYLRLRFVNGLHQDTVAHAEEALGRFYLRGFTGGFGEPGKGLFHFLSEPFAIGAEGLRYELDLGRSRFEAALGLVEALVQLHQQEPIEVAVLGDGVLPVRGAVTSG